MIFKTLALLLSLVIILFYGLSFEVIGYRKYNGQLNYNYKEELNKMLDSGSISDDDIRNAALTYTANNLEFAFRKNPETNPNRILNNRLAHCKMYAYVFASCYNELAKNSSSRVAYGQFFLFGVNLHQFITSPFFATHDVCVIKNAAGEVQIIDPLLYDYFYIRNFD